MHADAHPPWAVGTWQCWHRDSGVGDDGDRDWDGPGLQTIGI
jgi:hypothetical protein